MPGFDSLKKEVVEKGLCTNCGMCAGVCPKQVVKMDYELEEPTSRGLCPPRCTLCYQSCAGKDIPMPDLERMLFRRVRNPAQELLGICQEYRRGQSTEERIVIAGASGGLVSSLLIYALEKGLIDGAVVAGMSEEHPWRAIPKIATNKEEVIDNAQSKTARIPMNSILGEALSKGMKRLAVVGLPCQVHSIRKMQMAGKARKVASSIRYVIGLFCGSNWPHNAMEHVIDEIFGLSLEEVAKIESRAGAYPGLFTVTAKNGRKVALPWSIIRLHILGFRHDRCFACLDYSNDLADVSVGDYHHPEMVRGVPGWSSCMIRTDQGRELVMGAQDGGYITTELINKDYLLQGPYDWKIHGGSYHLAERRRHGWPVPDFHLPLTPGPLRRKLNYEHPHFRG